MPALCDMVYWYWDKVFKVLGLIAKESNQSVKILQYIIAYMQQDCFKVFQLYFYSVCNYKSNLFNMNYCTVNDTHQSPKLEAGMLLKNNSRVA